LLARGLQEDNDEIAALTLTGRASASAIGRPGISDGIQTKGRERLEGSVTGAGRRHEGGTPLDATALVLTVVHAKPCKRWGRASPGA